MARLLEAGLISQNNGNAVCAPEIPNPARLIPPPTTSRAACDEPPQVVRLVVSREAAETRLTAELDAAPCPATARAIFRALFHVALDVARACGFTATVTRAVFHLPAELVMAYVGRAKSAFYENLGHLRRLGLIDAEAHMGDLRGEKVATGTLWAVSLQPGRVLAGHAAPVRLRHEDWAHEWRNLNKDVRECRTVYRVLNGPVTAAQSHPDSQELPEGADRGKIRGKTPAQTVNMDVLADWAIKSAAPPSSDTLTVRPTPSAAQSVIWSLGDGARVPRWERARVVDRQAHALAAAFGDGEGSLGFWRKLVWNVLRGIDAGTDLSDDVGAVLAVVLRDVLDDQRAGDCTLKKPAAKANAALQRAGLLDLLRGYEYRTVGSRPAA